jgi:hypothetical protein
VVDVGNDGEIADVVHELRIASLRLMPQRRSRGVGGSYREAM